MILHRVLSLGSLTLITLLPSVPGSCKASSSLAHLAPVDGVALLVAYLGLGAAATAALLPRHLPALRGDDVGALPPVAARPSVRVGHIPGDTLLGGIYWKNSRGKMCHEISAMGASSFFPALLPAVHPRLRAALPAVVPLPPRRRVERVAFLLLDLSSDVQHLNSSLHVRIIEKMHGTFRYCKSLIIIHYLLALFLGHLFALLLGRLLALLLRDVHAHSLVLESGGPLSQIPSFQFQNSFRFSARTARNWDGI